jgi:hypothetical protein
MHPYLTQAVAAERVADFRRDAAAHRTARLALANRHAARLMAASHVPAARQAVADDPCQSSMTRAA